MKRAFTVFELLATIAVVLVTLGILLPIVTGPRHKARLLVCTNNLKTIGQAMDSCLAANKETYPWGMVGEDKKEDLRWVNLMGKKGSAESGSGSTPADNRPLNFYLQQTQDKIAEDNRNKITREKPSTIEQITRCPNDAGDSLWSQDKPLAETAGTSYLYPYRQNSQVHRGEKVFFSGVWVIEGHRRYEVLQPARKLVICEPALFLNRAAADANNHWHNDFEPLYSNILFADGHVALIERITNLNKAPLMYELPQPLDDEVLREMEGDPSRPYY